MQAGECDCPQDNQTKQVSNEFRFETGLSIVFICCYPLLRHIRVSTFPYPLFFQRLSKNRLGRQIPIPTKQASPLFIHSACQTDQLFFRLVKSVSPHICKSPYLNFRNIFFGAIVGNVRLSKNPLFLNNFVDFLTGMDV